MAVWLYLSTLAPLDSCHDVTATPVACTMESISHRLFVIYHTRSSYWVSLEHCTHKNNFVDFINTFSSATTIVINYVLLHLDMTYFVFVYKQDVCHLWHVLLLLHHFSFNYMYPLPFVYRMYNVIIIITALISITSPCLFCVVFAMYTTTIESFVMLVCFMVKQLWLMFALMLFVQRYHC